MKITQGTFSFLPDLTDEQIGKQVEYCLNNGWAINVEFTDDPHPRNTYWEMWGMPMFDLKDPAAIMYEVSACRKAHPNHYIKVNAFDSTRGWETVKLSFIVNRPKHEPGFGLVRQEAEGRVLLVPSVREALVVREEEEGGERGGGPERVQRIALLHVPGELREPEEAEQGPRGRPREVHAPVLPERADAEQDDAREQEEVEGDGHGRLLRVPDLMNLRAPACAAPGRCLATSIRSMFRRRRGQDRRQPLLTCSPGQTQKVVEAMNCDLPSGGFLPPTFLRRGRLQERQRDKT